jgi:hypothetical protein
MTGVDWRVGLVVVGDQRALDRGVELPVEPDPGRQGEQPLGDPDPDALDGAGAMALQAELVLEGVDDRLDPLANPTQGAEPGGFIGRSGRTSRAPSAATTCSNARPAGPLSARMTMPGRRMRWRAARSNRPSATSRSPSFGLARHQAVGRPSGQASTYSLSPQNQRLWRRSSPWPAQPARAERRTVSREAHRRGPGWRPAAATGRTTTGRRPPRRAGSRRPAARPGAGGGCRWPGRRRRGTGGPAGR